MLLIKFFTHPTTLILSFFFIIIIGEHWAGFYLWYLLMSLFHGVTYAIVGLIGFLLIIIGSYQIKNSKAIIFFLNIIGAFFMDGSLFLFFALDDSNYNIGTFYQVVPVVLIGLFTLVNCCFIIKNVVQLKSFITNKR